MLRRLTLFLASNGRITDFIRRKGMSTGFARRFVAGETLDEAVQAIVELNRAGMTASLDFLGESITDRGEAGKAAGHYLEILDAISRASIRCNISVKLTQLGLDIDLSIALENMRHILTKAKEYEIFVRIDMEGSRYTELTLEAFRQLHREFGNGVGPVLQSYLYRTEADLESLMPLKPNVRLCKGAYMEPPEVAFPDKADVDKNYVRLLEKLLLEAGYTGIATHDEAIIRHARRFIADKRIGQERFEFQMLYGIRRDLQARLVREGYKLRVYVPYGSQWLPYFMRRLGERPANLWFVLRNVFKG